MTAATKKSSGKDSLLPPRSPGALMYYSADVRTLVFTSIYFGLLAFQWRYSPFTSTIVSVVLWLALALFSFIGAVAVHNTIHCPVFYSKSLNSAFQVVLSLVYGHPVSSYVPGHNLSHHKYMQQPKDVMRTTKMRYRWHLLNFLLFAAHIGFDMLSNDATYFEAQKKAGRPIYRQMLLEKAVLYTEHAVLLILDWKKWIVFVFLPHLLAKMSIITLNLLQHDGTDSMSKYNHSRNFTGQMMNFLTYNNGYHTIHHWYPGRHWSLLRDEHERLVKPHMHESLDEPSIFAYIFKAYVFPGKRIDFKGRPMGIPEYVEDVPWAYNMHETYSSKPYLWRTADDVRSEEDLAAAPTGTNKAD